MKIYEGAPYEFSGLCKVGDYNSECGKTDFYHMYMLGYSKMLDDIEMHKKFNDSIGMTGDWRKRGPVPLKKDRLCFEARLIGTMYRCVECFPSENWLGQSSPIDKIRKSGLWQVMELYSSPLSDEELNFISTSLIRDSEGAK